MLELPPGVGIEVHSTQPRRMVQRKPNLFVEPAMIYRCCAAVAVLCAVGAHVSAAEYELQTTKDTPQDLVSAEVSALMQPSGYKVMKGPKRTACEVWFRKQVPIKEDFTPSSSVIYPLEVGELVGVIRFKRKTTDFRDQEIPSGAYTLRYGLQPVDGNHVGTSATRDFLLLLPADADVSPERLTRENLIKLSNQAAGSKHPANLYLAKPATGQQLPTLRHIEEPNWWALEVKLAAAAGDKKTDLPLELVVVGKQAE